MRFNSSSSFKGWTCVFYTRNSIVLRASLISWLRFSAFASVQISDSSGATSRASRLSSSIHISYLSSPRIWLRCDTVSFSRLSEICLNTATSLSSTFYRIQSKSLVACSRFSFDQFSSYKTDCLSYSIWLVTTCSIFDASRLFVSSFYLSHT